MPHLRKRHLFPIVKKLLSYSPIVAIFGHRQVGKTTLAQQFQGQYLTLDLPQTLRLAREDPEGFIKQNMSSRLIIDECQLAPELFPTLKDWVRRNPKPGQFLLTGSVRFSSRKAIRESMTGRYVAAELIPMDHSEIHQIPLNDSLLQIQRSKTFPEFKRVSWANEKTLLQYIRHGGLPGMFAVRDHSILHQKFETQIETLLERDLRLLIQTSVSLSSLRRLLVELAKAQGQILNLVQLSRISRISTPTLRKMLPAFEAMFLIRKIATRGGRRKDCVFFEDIGEAFFLHQDYQHWRSRGPEILYAVLRGQYAYRSELGAKFFRYETAGGALVPLAVESSIGTMGLVPIDGELPNASESKSSISFLKSYPKSKVIFISFESTSRIISHRSAVYPIYNLL